MADILFTHSYFLKFDPKEFRAMMPYPPLGTLYAASSARERGYSVALFDSMLAESEQELRGALSRHRPRVVVIYDDDFNYLTKMCLSRMREAAFCMASIAREAGCTVILHGSDAADHLEKYFSRDANFVLCGEGEQTLGEALDHIFGSNPCRGNIRGLAFVSDGKIVRNAPREPLRTLDTLPFPAWDLVDVEGYRRAWKNRHGYFSANMVTTRGCPFHCNWCAKPLYGQVYTTRSPKNVVDEMLWLQRTVRPDHIWFCDDIFALKPGWVAAFASEVESRNARIPFKCLARVDLLLRDNAVEPLKRAGCRTVWVGAESGSQKILDAMEKGTTVAQIYQATARLKAAGIKVGFFIQYGYPGESWNDIELTLKMIHDCMPDDIGISVSYPLPGTKFYERVQHALGEKHNWIDSQDLDLMFPGEFIPDFYRVLHRVTHKRLRIWQGQKIVSERLRRPLEFDPRDLRKIAATVYHTLTVGSLESRLQSLARSSGSAWTSPGMSLPVSSR
jgi:anaerobic magnesium-protoporphyrin IX monomethyl ester cyclase